MKNALKLKSFCKPMSYAMVAIAKQTANIGWRSVLLQKWQDYLQGVADKVQVIFPGN